MKTETQSLVDAIRWNQPAGQKLTFQTRTTLHAAQPADRVTDNRDQFRKRWYRVSEATNFTEVVQ